MNPKAAICLRTVLVSVVALLVTGSRVGAADSGYLSIQGTFDSASGANQDVFFTLSNTSAMTFRTYANVGGTNGAGAAIAAGGIDSVLNLFSTAGGAALATNDDITPGVNRDSQIVRSTAPGSYFVRMTNFNSVVGDKHFALDVRNDTGPTTYNSLPGGFRTVTSVSMGGTGAPSTLSLLSVATNIAIAGNLEVQHGGRIDLFSIGTLTVGSETLGGGAGVSAPGAVFVNQPAGAHVVNGLLNISPADGTVAYNQTGGTTTAGSLRLDGTSASSSPFYFLSGTASLSTGGELIVEDGQFVQDGGTHTSTGVVKIGRVTGGRPATFRLAGGTLSAPLIDITVSGVLNLTGTGSVVNGTAIENRGEMIVNGPVTAAAAITLYAGSTTSVNGPLTVNGSVTLENATVTGDVGSGEKLILPGGTLSGRGEVNLDVQASTVRAVSGNLVLNGFTFTSLAGAGATVSNDPGANLFVNASVMTVGGNVTVNSGGSVVFTKQGLTNTHTVTLKGGTLGAAGPVTNAAAGTVSGFGTISANVSNAGSMTFNGPTNVVGGLVNSGTISVRNDQTLVTGLTTNTGTITLQTGGKVIFDGGLAPGAAPGAAVDGPAQGGAAVVPLAGSVTVNAGGLVVTPFVRQANFVLSGTAAQPAAVLMRTKGEGGQTSVVKALSIANGRLDLADTALIVDDPAANAATTLAAVRGSIIAGRNGGDWQGSGIVSSLAAADAGKAIGYARATEILGAAGGTFQGQAAGPAATVARYTLAADATLDGVVDFNDLVRLAQNYNTTVSAAPGVAGSWWYNGDFTYDGAVDFEDLVKLAQNYNTALPAEAVPGAAAGFEGDLARAFAAVPEPSGVWLVLGVAGMMARRRGRRGAR